MISRLKILSILLGASLVGFAEMAVGQADILSVEVETYYISDENDETDTDGGMPLPAGSKTYRVFLQLAQGSKLRSIYGGTNHPVKIESTAAIYNNEDRGELFGHLIQSNRLDDNTVALDSWLSFGAASDDHYGVLKSEDTDGSLIGGTNNDGGSENIAGGLLANEDPLAGIPLTVQDGLLPGTNLTPQNFTVVGDAPDSAFGEFTLTSSFISTNFNAITVSGVEGPTAENKILIAQITTTGELSFELNIEVINPQGEVFRYVAQNSGQDETISSWLSYPPICGCTDPDYLEYDAIAGCDDGSCMTLVQLGCMDSDACNYNAEANFNIPGLCCYGPDDCNGLDVSIVCPTLSTDDKITRENLRIYPNPADHALTVKLSTPSMGRWEVAIYDMLGKKLLAREITGNGDEVYTNFELEALPSGTYLLRMGDGKNHTHTLFVKR